MSDYNKNNCGFCGGDHTERECPDTSRQSELPAPSGYAARLEDQLRVELYNAACEYAREVDKPMGNWEAISAAADKLEVAAQNFILRSAA